jgi:vacuolar-type H+-ATPase subunit H
MSGTQRNASSGDVAVEPTPLELIRKRESELTGRVLSAKREADVIVAEARKQASETIASATTEASLAAKEHAARLLDEAREEAARVVSEAEAEAAALGETMTSRRGKAVAHVLDSVVGR